MNYKILKLNVLEVAVVFSLYIEKGERIWQACVVRPFG
jgi:hypothetical protein